MTQDTLQRVGVALTLTAITLISFFVLPGHTWLASDTQIYAPLLEHMADPSVLARDLIVSRPHLAWTLYDEVALTLHRITTRPFHDVLLAEQLLFRLLGIWGIYLIATSAKLPRLFALMLACLFAIGATIPGPALMTVETDPVPRGFALPLVLLAIGLACHSRLRWASAAASIGLLFHAPSTLPFWLIFFVILWRRREWRPLVPLAVSIAVLVVSWRLQQAGTESPPLFGAIGKAWEEILRFRTSYIFVSMWPGRLFVLYGVLSLIAAAALFRLWHGLDETHRAFFSGLLLAGTLSLPVSWLLLDRIKWSFMTQFQPARYVLFLTLTTLLLTTIAAARARGSLETAGWMLAAVLIPSHAILMRSANWLEGAAIISFCAVAIAASRFRAAVPFVSILLVALFAIVTWSRPSLDNSELDRLCAWGSTTPEGAIFHFPDAGRSLVPGVFRARARRAVYVDWKAGGQANFFEDLALEWRERWRTSASIHPPGVDYIVVPPDHSFPNRTPVFQNNRFAVYSLN